MNQTDYEKILREFDIPGNLISAKPYGSGHINDTVLVEYVYENKNLKYILRRINDYVFHEPLLIVENTLRVTTHYRKKLIENNEKDINRKVLTLYKTKNGQYYFVDSNGGYWCLLSFIPNAYTVDKVETENQAYQAAKAFGKFQKYLTDIDISRCHETIKNFHDLDKRLAKYDESVSKDVKNRVQNIPDEINKIEKFRYVTEEYLQLRDKNIPLRITHNDTKINNVMLDEKTSEGLCVIDLDTVMPGIILNDFGDMVRTFTSPADEDEKNTEKVFVRMNIFEAMTRGYFSEVKNILTEDENNNLVTGAKIIVYEQAVRFLTDFIDGDVYYKIKYDKHNLVRAVNQLALLDSIEKNYMQMQAVVEKYSKQRNE